MFRPQPVIRRDMEHKAAARRGARERVRIAQIARDTLHVRAPESCSMPAQGAHLMAAFQEQPRHVPAHKSGCAGDERGFHVVPLIFRTGQVSIRASRNERERTIRSSAVVNSFSRSYKNRICMLRRSVRTLSSSTSA